VIAGGEIVIVEIVEGVAPDGLADAIEFAVDLLIAAVFEMKPLQLRAIEADVLEAYKILFEQAHVSTCGVESVGVSYTNLKNVLVLFLLRFQSS
jgi:hypothetical protein